MTAPVLLEDLVTRMQSADLPELAESARWLLAQLAAGACGPTAADSAVVARVREALSGVSPTAVERVCRAVSGRDDFLVVDVLDAMLCFGCGPDREVVVDALRSFAGAALPRNGASIWF